MPNKLRKSPPMKESDLVRLCLDWLRAERIFHYRNNTGSFAGEYKGKKRFVRFGAKGSPDIVAVVPYCFVFGLPIGQYYGIECKGGDGRQSEEQVQFQCDLERAGGKYLIVRSLDELKKGLGR